MEYSIHTSLTEYPCDVVTNLTWLFTLQKGPSEKYQTYNGVGFQIIPEPGNRQQVETDRLSKLASDFNTVLIDTESLIIVCSGRLKVRALETPVSWLLNSITYLCML